MLLRIKKKHVFEALIISMVADLLCACAKAPAEGYPLTRVSVIMPHSNDSYWDIVAGGIKAAYEELGASYNIDISILTPQLNYSTEQMTDILKQQIAAKVDVIVLQGNEDEKLKTVLNTAYEEGITIICMDTDEEDFPKHTYIGTDNYSAGRLLGEKILEFVRTNGAGKVKVISGEEHYSNMQLRLKGLTDVLTDEGIEISDVVYDHYDGLTVMKEYEAPTEADILVCLEGTGLQTLAKMNDSHGDKYRYIIGFDADDSLINNAADGVVIQDMEGIGRKVVEEIVRQVKSGRKEEVSIYTDVQWVTQPVKRERNT